MDLYEQLSPFGVFLTDQKNAGDCINVMRFDLLNLPCASGNTVLAIELPMALYPECVQRVLDGSGSECDVTYLPLLRGFASLIFEGYDDAAFFCKDNGVSNPLSQVKKTHIQPLLFVQNEAGQLSAQTRIMRDENDGYLIRALIPYQIMNEYESDNTVWLSAFETKVDKVDVNAEQSWVEFLAENT